VRAEQPAVTQAPAKQAASKKATAAANRAIA
jgi:hypothetical protein